MTPTASGAAPFLGLIVKIQVAVLCLLLVFLFIAVVTAPSYAVLWGGLLGARGVWLVSLMVVLIAVQYCAVRGSRWMPETDTGAGPGGRRSARWARFLFLCVFLVLVNRFVANVRSPYAPGLVTGHDQPQYYAYLHSWLFDRDLDSTNEYAAIPGIPELMARVHPGNPGHNVAPVGTPVLWVPFYVAAHGVVAALGALGVPELVADGLGAPYAAAAAFGSLILGWAGALLSQAVLRRSFSERTALFATLTLWLATPLLWYLIYEPWMSHAASFFAAALAVFLWDRFREGRTRWQWAALGGAIGLAMLVRPSHLVLLALPVADALRPAAPGEGVRRRVAGLALCAASVFLVFTPQLFTWWARSGFSPPPGNPMRWTEPALVRMLFSAHHGIFAWHPVMLLGFLGLIPLWRRCRRTTVVVAVILAVSVYLNAALDNWWGGASFGARRFCGLLPILAPALAAFGSWAVGLARRRPAIPVAAVVLALIVYNGLLAAQLSSREIPASEPTSFRQAWGASAEQFHDVFGNPFSYPANLWFAWKHGVRPSQYDVVSGAVLNCGAVEVHAKDMRPYLGQGWDVSSPAAHATALGFVANRPRATLLVPLLAGHSYDIVLDLRLPRGFGHEQAARFALNGRDLDSAPLKPDEVNRCELHVEPGTAQEGVNELAIQFAYVRAKGERTVQYGIDVPSRRPAPAAALLSRLAVRPLDE
ncbi:MAG: hypothetical protein JXR94_13455 [Candidatus Hydrogenedentes bacterium]|nr:hypothetical protein [Candidatus Hydrogenedentota bacterium]